MISGHWSPRIGYNCRDMTDIKSDFTLHKRCHFVSVFCGFKKHVKDKTVCFRAIRNISKMDAHWQRHGRIGCGAIRIRNISPFGTCETLKMRFQNRPPLKLWSVFVFFRWLRKQLNNGPCDIGATPWHFSRGHLTWRDCVPPPHTLLQAPHTLVSHCPIQRCSPQRMLSGGLSDPSKQNFSSYVFASEPLHWTSRVWVPPPHVALHCDHELVTKATVDTFAVTVPTSHWTDRCAQNKVNLVKQCPMLQLIWYRSAVHNARMMRLTTHMNTQYVFLGYLLIHRDGSNVLKTQQYSGHCSAQKQIFEQYYLRVFSGFSRISGLATMRNITI